MQKTRINTMTLDDAIQIHSTKMRSTDDVHSLYAQWFIELRNLRIYVEKLKDKNRELQGMLDNIPDEVIEEYSGYGDEIYEDDDCYDSIEDEEDF